MGKQWQGGLAPLFCGHVHTASRAGVAFATSLLGPLEAGVPGSLDLLAAVELGGCHQSPSLRVPSSEALVGSKFVTHCFWFNW